MIDRRRCPRTAFASCSTPSPSGPRCRRAVSMRCMASPSSRVGPTIPAMPHMLGARLVPAGRAFCQHGALEQILVTLRAPADEVILDAAQIIAANLGAPLRSIAQCAHCVVERAHIVERHHVTGRGGS